MRARILMAAAIALFLAGFVMAASAYAKTKKPKPAVILEVGGTPLPNPQTIVDVKKNV